MPVRKGGGRPIIVADLGFQRIGIDPGATAVQEQDGLAVVPGTLKGVQDAPFRQSEAREQNTADGRRRRNEPGIDAPGEGCGTPPCGGRGFVFGDAADQRPQDVGKLQSSVYE
ncbi:hypothetical protein BTM25_41450 [Actinomadura rubteroloni]|uniref:Uncharacterized protein n=1 Tax=Actinomadura rubteroloni TaxID=1926885 RepID=A0A2P4UKB3_9ACTN|nr:hypothetical protein BTM25_41450 [Actinomadura rubteroloni]